ncbi:cytochrome P450 98A3 [Coprinopsis sp. MPI-PUGE-AT-0042]|nr:cytochrome P450 98A3 [Coprinopsis sp. MPI-PUGE-AT-0042]
MDLLESLPLKENGAWIAAGLLFVSAVAVRASSRGKLPTPPGPRGLPIVGNILQMPSEEPWKVYADWGKQYGDVIYLEALGQRFLILNSLSSINALLASRAANYSDRAWSPIIELAGGRWSFSEKDYGEEWRDHRRAFHQHFNHTQTQNWRPIVQDEVPSFLRQLLSSPEDFRENMRLFFGTMIMRIVYGANTPVYNRGLVRDTDAFVSRLVKVLQPGRMWVGIFPWLQHVPAWLPGAGWKRHLQSIAKLRDNVISRPWKDTLSMVAGNEGDDNATTSFATELIASLPSPTDPRYEYMYGLSRDVAAASYIAGSDTTGSSAQALFLALTMYPKIQRKAQQEIDEVIGREKLPTFEDLENLPYVKAVIKEVTRWHTAVPLAVPHLSREEEEFNRWRIPAKTVVLPNSWAIMHDADLFDDPMGFNPERYLKDGQVIDDPSILDPEASAFGYGRRICPGRHVFHDSLGLVAASVLMCFNLEAPTDEFGNLIPLSLKPSSTLVSAPSPFQCKITPRSAMHAALIRSL